MKNVLVFPCGSEIGLELNESLRNSIHINLLGGSSVPDHGMYAFKSYIPDIPNSDDPDFIDSLNRIVDEHSIDFIYPAHDSVVTLLSAAYEKGEISCRVLGSSAEACRIARSKSLTYKTLGDVIQVPRIYDINDLSAVNPNIFPLFLKPDTGQGSKGASVAGDMQDVNYLKSKDPSLIAVEYLPGREFTVDCFTDRNGNVLVAQGRQRARILNGISANSTHLDDERFMNLAQAINQKITMRGAWFFQVKEDSELNLVLMEIAPRVAGTMGLTRGKGVNLPLMTVFDAMDLPVSVDINTYELTIDRALKNSFSHNIKFRHAYVDLDDFLIINNSINIQAVSFLYQCINDGVKLHLVTRHAYNVDTTLKNYRLNLLFDSIHHLKNGEHKSDYITEADAIFLDDSFAERQDVHRKKKIPVFDTHMLDVLIRNYGLQ